MKKAKELLYLVPLALWSCQPAGEDRSDFLTDLKDNELVAEAFSNYKSQNSHCSQGSAGRRVMIAGFGQFSGPNSSNISGVVAMSMARQEFWPSQAQKFKELNGDPNSFFRHEDLTTSNGGYAVQRQLNIAGKSFDVCFLYLDVVWDLSASIILHEASLHKPELIIMSGMNGGQRVETFWEGSAINNAVVGVTGFDNQGNNIIDNVAVSDRAGAKVLPSLAYNAVVPLTWDATFLADVNRELIQEINPKYGSRAASARTENTYICNNVSIAVASALAGNDLQLAGGSIAFSKESFDFKAQVGFLHYPSDSSVAGTVDRGKDILGWSKVVANTMVEALP